MTSAIAVDVCRIDYFITPVVFYEDSLQFFQGTGQIQNCVLAARV